MYVLGHQKYWLHVRCLLENQHNFNENRNNETSNRYFILDHWMLLKHICGAVYIVSKWLLEFVTTSFKLSCFYNKHLTRNRWFRWPSTYVCLDVFLMGMHINEHLCVRCLDVFLMGIHINEHLRVRCSLQKQHNLNENRNNETIWRTFIVVNSALYLMRLFI